MSIIDDNNLITFCFFLLEWVKLQLQIKFVTHYIIIITACILLFIHSCHNIEW